MKMQKPEMFFFIPSGKVHAIGNGILLAEIQQTSDITYRIYDYNRKGTVGKNQGTSYQTGIRCY